MLQMLKTDLEQMVVNQLLGQLHLYMLEAVVVQVEITELLERQMDEMLMLERVEVLAVLLPLEALVDRLLFLPLAAVAAVVLIALHSSMVETANGC